MKKIRDSHSIAKPFAAAPDFQRRRMLQAMLGAGVVGLSPGEAAAQARGPGTGGAADSRGSLLALPREALVIGNSKYKEAPLKNPANDADAIGGALKRIGFQVTQSLDAGREAMLETIQVYGSRLEKQGAIGLFYFAGHGLQLNWRNYLVPVDAVIDNPDDVRARAVDLAALLQALTQARNPMNVIILDACRDNPFGTRLTTGQRGLSQFDAPSGSLLAYATAPGNVASDGDGANGLYTENLLREMQVPEAKIEDIFKRVRLQVRRRTNGQQIPWESTSLEDDFYFVPPRALVAQAEEETARQRKRETEALEKRRADEEAERKRKQEQALREAKLAAEEADRKRKQELAALEQRRIAEEAERKRIQDLALKEAQRVAEEAERKRREEQAMREAKLAEDEAARKYQQELALREKQRVLEEAERKRKEEQVVREAKLAEEEAARKYQQELAQQEKRRAQEEAERRQKQQAVPVGKPDAAALERLFEEELAIWEKIKSSKVPGPLEEYLLRYPSGRFAELAQHQLDRVLAAQGEKRIEIISAAENPFTKGTIAAGTRYTVGNSYTYRVTDLYTKREVETFTNTIISITDTEVTYDTGLITDLLGNLLRARDGRVFGPSQFVPLEYSVGKRWSTRFKITVPNFGTGQVELDMRITTRETITVPAGSFDTYRIEARGWSSGSWGTAQVTRNVWVAPGRVRGAIVSEDLRKGGPKIIASERLELVSYRQA